MKDYINIAKNDKTIFLTIDIKNISEEIIKQVNDILRKEASLDNKIGYVDDEEQKEIEAIMSSMTDEDREITLTERLTFRL